MKIKKAYKKSIVNFRFFYRYVGNLIFVLICLSIIVGVLDGLGLAMFMPLLEGVSNKETMNSTNMGDLVVLLDLITSLGFTLTLNVVLLTMLTLFILKGGFKFVESYCKVLIRMKFLKKIRYILIDEMTTLSYSSFTKLDSGKIHNTLSGEVIKIGQAFSFYFHSLTSLILLIVYLFLAFLSNSQFALLVIIGGGISNYLYRGMYNYTITLSKKITDENHTFNGLLIQFIQYFKYLKATLGIYKFSSKLKAKVDVLEILQKKIGLINSVLLATREPIVISVVICIIIIQIHFFDANIGSIILSLMFFYRSLSSLMTLQNSWNSFLNNIGSISSINSFLEYLGNYKEVKGDINISTFSDKIRIEDLSFGYGASNSTLKTINMSIKKNETIALIGESGSGKTTLINLLVGLFDNYKGRISIDNFDYKKIKTDNLKKKIGYITQDPVIFSDTIFNNITFWADKNEKTLEKFHSVLKKTALFEFVQNLPQKEKTHLGDNGILVSGGQKQRISIARELYKEVEILLLDEATSALDSKTEKIIQLNIDNLKGKYTLIIIAHRLSTVRNADKIVLLNNGMIEDIGSFEKLLKENLRFKQLVELQQI